MANEDERRRAERIPINAEFAAMPSSTYISDLSEYGVFVHTSELAPLGTKLRLRFTALLDDPVIISAEGRVVRHSSVPTPGMGIEFTEVEPAMIQRINEVVARQQPRDSGPPLSAKAQVAASPPSPASSEGDEAEDADEVDPLGFAGGSGLSFKVPPLPGQRREDVDESQKTGLFHKVEAEPVEDDSE